MHKQYLIFLLFLMSGSLFAQNSEQYNSFPETMVHYKGKQAVSSLPTPLTGPKIDIKERVIDFGKVHANDTLSYRIYYTNTGTDPLLLTKVRSNCGCTVAYYPKTPLAPGESNHILITIDVQHAGLPKKLVAIYSNAINEYDSTINSSRIVVKFIWK